ncbi:hypothetical protein LEP1GSC036_0566 [Leptospira weilii str. 2006001853]|uniref:Uncharacterized protein n=1 Tax=Leptospira weilii str. 2006001853 TaxID=1001589 RepID=A0A828YZN1_9LEPT|nr:hypothetical protein LEP1GSC036_0566 [Leptospira weilii str. 2006001853]EMN42915.1 hypothetical protein LEP1GSC086_1804 [Leptospira weilii str. LNT 1234]
MQVTSITSRRNTRRKLQLLIVSISMITLKKGYRTFLD